MTTTTDRAAPPSIQPSAASDPPGTGPVAAGRTDGGPLERGADRLSGPRIVTLSILFALPLVALWVFWQAQVAFFLLFAGMLFAALIDAATRGLDRVVDWDRWIKLSVVVGLMVAAFAALVWFGGSYLVTQFDELLGTVEKQADEVSELVGLVRGNDVAEAETAMGVLRQGAQLLPGSGSGAGTALSFVQGVFGGLANAAIIFFVGVFLAVEPNLYRRGAVHLFPRSVQEPVGEAMDACGQTMRNWLVGKLASMAMIFVFTWIGLLLVGFPFAFAIGLLAGALAFIPNIGPILTYIPLVLVGLSAGSTTVLLYGVGVYLVAQTIESYIFTPLIQKHMVELPPALIFFAQILGGILFGLWGVALATPIAAVLKTLIEQLYTPGEADTEEPVG